MGRPAWLIAEQSRREGRGVVAPAEFRLRSHFRAMLVKIAVGGARRPPRSSGGVSRMGVTVIWSAQRRPIVVRAGSTLRGMPGVAPATMERWSQIDAGIMPEDEDIEAPWTEDEAQAIAQEEVNEVYRRQRDQEARVKRDLATTVEDAQARIDYHTDQADRYDGPAAYYHRLRATEAATEARQARTRADQEMEEIAVEAREERRDIVDKVTRKVEQMQEEWDERIATLQSALGEEIRSTLESEWSNAQAPIEAVEDWQF